MPEEEFTSVPVKFIEDLSQKIEKLQNNLRRKQSILTKVNSIIQPHLKLQCPKTWMIASCR